MKNIHFTLLLAAAGSLPNFASADFSGSTYTLNSPYSLCITNSNLTISSVVPAAYNVGTLIVSNAAASPITINWAAPGRAIGVGTTNQLLLPGGELAQINVNATFPGLVIYQTQLEQAVPSAPANPNPLIPDLLYYELTEGAQSYQTPAGFFENPPVYLADSSTHGGDPGTVTAADIPIQWVPNQNATPVSAIHFNGNSTMINAGNSPLFNFTTNLFSINIWVRNLTYPCPICGNGVYLSSGWYVIVNPSGEIVVAAENPGSDKYVATSSTVAFNGQWCMITVVRVDTSTVLIYRNALLQNTVGSYANPGPSSNDLIFGENYNGNHYDGDLGTIRIYSHPLSTNEINALYLNDTTP